MANGFVSEITKRIDGRLRVASAHDRAIRSMRLPIEVDRRLSIVVSNSEQNFSPTSGIIPSPPHGPRYLSVMRTPDRAPAFL